MIKTIELKNFTVIHDDLLEFGPGLNVFVGQSGMGKSHLLKLLYVLSAFASNPSARAPASVLAANLHRSLLENFLPEELCRLIRRRKDANQCQADIGFDDDHCDLSFKISARSNLTIHKRPTKFPQGAVFLPSRELMTLCPWFPPAYDIYHLEFERAWRDTCILLQAPGRKGPRNQAASALLTELENALQGRIIMDAATNRMYLQTGDGSFEMPLVAEELRKLGMLYRLIQTGTFEDRKILFWDAPEAHANPKCIRLIAKCLWSLASQGVQIFIASQSPVLIRALMMLQKNAAEGETTQSVRCFSLKGPEEAIEAIEAAGDLEDIAESLELDEKESQLNKSATMEV